jgi:4-amino-4-deoxy-L-arabinose transferase-like glycosyltransferase
MPPRSKKAASRQPDSVKHQSWISANWHWVVLGVILMATAAVRIRLLSAPLERDEGEFAYMGQLMLHGIAPYKIAYNMKLPGIYAAYALVMAVFGQTIIGIHLGLLLVNATSTVLTFLLGRRLIDRLAGVVAAGVYALTSLMPGTNGTSAHATQFVVPFVLGGCLLLLRAAETRRLRTSFLSGLLFGIAILMKQQAAPFAVFAFLYMAWNCIRTRPGDRRGMVQNLGLLSLGVITPFGLTCAALYKAGVFGTFWFWTFQYARQYVSEQPLAEGIKHLQRSMGRITTPDLWIWLVAAVGAIVIWFDGKSKKNRAFLIGFTVFAFAAVCPGLFFRFHYFIVFLPAVGLMTGLTVSWATRIISGRTSLIPLRAIPSVLILLAFCGAISNSWGFFVTQTVDENCAQMYAYNPFPQAIEIAKYIKAHSNRNDLVAVVGSEPEILFYSQRRTATGFLYMYGLVEHQRYAAVMQRQMIREIEQARPRYMVFVNMDLSWLRQPGADVSVYKWAGKYIPAHYRPVGLVDIPESGITSYYWGSDALVYRPESPQFVYVLERTPDKKAVGGGHQ